MFWLKIIQGLKVCPFKRNLPDHGGIPYTVSVKLTVSTNLSVFSAKENFFVDEILRNNLRLLLTYGLWISFRHCPALTLQ